MSDLIVPNIICFQTQNQLAILNAIGELLKGISSVLLTLNFVHAKTSLRARCVYACHRARNLSSAVSETLTVLLMIMRQN